VADSSNCGDDENVDKPAEGDTSVSNLNQNSVELDYKALLANEHQMMRAQMDIADNDHDDNLTDELSVCEKQPRLCSPDSILQFWESQLLMQLWQYQGHKSLLKELLMF